MWTAACLLRLAHVEHAFFGADGASSHRAETTASDAGGRRLGDVGRRNADADDGLNARRQTLLDALNRKESVWLQADQVHQSNIAIVDRVHRPTSVDAMLTSDPQVTLAIVTADCVPVLLSAANLRWVGAIHAGWRGTRLHIVKKAIQLFCQKADCDAYQVRVGIGPSIGPCCFEVADDVAKALGDAFDDTCTQSCIVKGKRNELSAYGSAKYHIDLAALNVIDALQAGVLPHNISKIDVCSACAKGLFSYRAMNHTMSRQVSLIGLRS